MPYVKSFSDFLNEGLQVIKRKYTENHPARIVSDFAPVREKVLAFVSEKTRVSLEEMQEFLRLMNEETGRKTSMAWVRANSKYFAVKEEEGKTYYSLSKEGRRVHEKLKSI